MKSLIVAKKQALLWKRDAADDDCSVDTLACSKSNSIFFYPKRLPWRSSTAYSKSQTERRQTEMERWHVVIDPARYLNQVHCRSEPAHGVYSTDWATLYKKLETTTCCNSWGNANGADMILRSQKSQVDGEWWTLQKTHKNDTVNLSKPAAGCYLLQAVI